MLVGSKYKWSWSQILLTVLTVTYVVMFYNNVGHFFFNPRYATDDALQQLFPFNKVLYPGLFEGDIVTEAMEQYLNPIHWWLYVGITKLTLDPFMTAHVVNFIQLAISCTFIFLACRKDWLTSLFGLAWFLHTRHVIQRMTGGLVRGWACVVISAFLYFASKRNVKGMLTVLVIGSVLHTPSTFLVGLVFALQMLWDFFSEFDFKAKHKSIIQKISPSMRRDIILSMIAAPIVIALAYYTTAMPEWMGQMTDYEDALTRPEFQPGGRFPFAPLLPAMTEIHKFGFQAFVDRWSWMYHTFLERSRLGWCVADIYIPIVLLLGVGITIYGWKKKQRFFPPFFFAYAIGALASYLLARAFAYKLYVPNRHLQIPFAMGFIYGYTHAFYNLGAYLKPKIKYIGLLGLCAIVIIPGLGLGGVANFNWQRGKHTKVWDFIRENTPLESVIAGHPTSIDPVMLYGSRAGYITTETAHPFYKGYFKKITPRIEKSLRAFYAKDLATLYSVLKDTEVDYFVFHRSMFLPRNLKNERYFEPFNYIIDEETQRDNSEYAYREVPREMGPESPYQVYRDAWFVVIDIHKLGVFLKEREANKDNQQERGESLAK